MFLWCYRLVVSTSTIRVVGTYHRIRYPSCCLLHYCDSRPYVFRHLFMYDIALYQASLPASSAAVVVCVWACVCCLCTLLTDMHVARAERHARCSCGGSSSSWYSHGCVMQYANVQCFSIQKRERFKKKRTASFLPTGISYVRHASLAARINHLVVPFPSFCSAWLQWCICALCSSSNNSFEYFYNNVRRNHNIKKIVEQIWRIWNMFI